MPDVVWTLLADPANRPMLALTLAGLVVIVFGPWAIVKIAQRRGGAQRGRRGGVGVGPFSRQWETVADEVDGSSRVAASRSSKWSGGCKAW